MGLFGALGEIVGAAVKVAVTPLAVVDDVVNVVTGNEPDTTKNLIKSVGDDLSKAGDELVKDM